MGKALVTVATDGFRDYVELPDGRTLNLGSVSVLKLVSALVSSPKLCRKALDSFLENGNAVVKVDVSRLEEILAPKRARWAGNDLVIPQEIREPKMSDQTKTASDVDTAGVKFSSLIRAFNQLQAQPSESTISTFHQASADFLEFATGKVAGVDDDAKHELEEFLENDSRVMKLKEDLIEDILAKGKYDHNYAKRLWFTWVDKGAEAYAKKFDEDDNALFPRSLREALSREIADKERKLIDEGGYEHLKNAGEIMKNAEVSGDAAQVAQQVGVDNPYANVAQDENNNRVGGLRLAAEEVPFVNEGLIHLVAAKVEHALKAIQASKKLGGDIAEGDLHVISTRLDSIAKTASIGDPDLRTALLDLARKADTVRDFFA